MLQRHIKNIFKLLFSRDFDRMRAKLAENVTKKVTPLFQKAPYVLARFEAASEWANTPTDTNKRAYTPNVALTNESLRPLDFQRMNAEASAIF